MMTRSAFAPALAFCLIACARDFPANPTPAELEEMHEVLNDCLEGIIPLEKRNSGTCENVEDALIAHYGGLDAYLAALRSRGAR